MMMMMMIIIIIIIIIMEFLQKNVKTLTREL